MGSKARIAKHILPILLDAAKSEGISAWVEPFVGGGNMIERVPPEFKRIGYDINPHCIMALIGIRDFFSDLPDDITEEYYKQCRQKQPGVISSWVRFIASFGGKLDNGYARESGSTSKTFAGYGKRNAQKQSPLIQGVYLACSAYKDIVIEEKSLIYCDPPYQGVTGYKNEKFDHDAFFDWCRQKKNDGHLVFLSEYSAPFECVWEMEIKTNFASQRSAATSSPVEKLFKV